MDLPAAHASLVAALYRLRNADGGWPYYAGKKSRLEPTSWAMLATSVTVESTPLLGWLNPAGLLVEPSTGQVNYTFNAVAGLAIGAQLPATAGRLAAALAGAFGEVIPPSPAIRQNTSLRGWGWTPGTFTWIEPTAWSVLLLKQWPGDRAIAKARIDEAEAVLRDRVCPGGGWNFGNGEVYGQGLPAHVPPTAIGTLALQDRVSEPIVTDAAGFLERRGPAEGSTTALALSVLALSTIGQPVAHLGEQLASHHSEAVSLGNVAAIGMAAYALDCVIERRAPRAFALAGVRS